MEAQALIEDALDSSLSGSRKRALDLHLSRCDSCRAFFEREREEHRRWFQAMNEPAALRRLPDGFTDQFVTEIAKWRTAPQRKWMFVRAFRRIAAALVAMLLFAGLSYAAVVAIDGLRGTEAANQDAVEGETGVTDVTGGTTVASDAPQSTELTAPSAPQSGRARSPSAPQSGRARSPSAPNQDSQSTPPGEQKMTRKKAAVAALTAALAAAPLSAADSSYFAASDAITLETGAMCIAGTAGELEARFRSHGFSSAIALNAIKFRTFIMTIR